MKTFLLMLLMVSEDEKTYHHRSGSKDAPEDPL